MNPYFQEMMARMQASSMLPPPNADYAPGGSMFPSLAAKKVPEDGTAPTTPPPQTLLGKIGQAIVPNTQAAMAGKGGGVG